MKTIIIIAVIVILVLGSYFFYNYFDKPKDSNKYYQGPVRPTDNETHFRLTGETIPLESK